jgi:hypothetical protein
MYFNLYLHLYIRLKHDGKYIINKKHHKIYLLVVNIFYKSN